MLNFKDQFYYVRKVVQNCNTEIQKENALRWAQDWAKRAKRVFPEIEVNELDLFLDVLSNHRCEYL